MSANVPVVKAVNPTRGDIRLTSGLTGTVEPADVVYVYAKASGDVTAVMVKAGDTVAGTLRDRYQTGGDCQKFPGRGGGVPVRGQEQFKPYADSLRQRRSVGPGL